jgi:hypothetical protein
LVDDMLDQLGRDRVPRDKEPVPEERLPQLAGHLDPHVGPDLAAGDPALEHLDHRLLAPRHDAATERLGQLGIVRHGADDRRPDGTGWACEEVGPALQDGEHVRPVTTGVRVRDEVLRHRDEHVAQQLRAALPPPVEDRLAGAGPRGYRLHGHAPDPLLGQQLQHGRADRRLQSSTATAGGLGGIDAHDDSLEDTLAFPISGHYRSELRNG